MPMTIKEHIEAGHYKELGHNNAERVPTSDSRFATIEGINEKGWICGWLDQWSWACTWTADGKLLSNGVSNDPCSPDLLPPPPRKVKVTAYAIMCGDGRIGHFQTAREDADKFAAGWKHHNAFVVELTGEYEESWS